MTSETQTSTIDALRALGGEVEFFEAGGVTAKVYGLPANTLIEQHVHDYDHLSFMIAGKATVVAGGVATEYEGFNVITILAGVKHTIVAAEPTLWACIHNTDRIDV